MKGLILCGEAGSELRPFTYTKAKQLIPIANKPIVAYIIESLKVSGIKDIGIVVGENIDDFIRTIGNGEKWGVDISYVSQKSPNGLAHAVLQCRKYIGKDDFVMVLGDNMISSDINTIIDFYKKEMCSAVLNLKYVDNPKKYGIARIGTDSVIEVMEKPNHPPCNLAITGIYLFNNDIYKSLEHIKPSWRGEYEITDAIQWMIDNGYKVKYTIMGGWWKDIDKVEDVLSANRFKLDYIKTDIKGSIDSSTSIEGQVILGKKSIVVNSILRGPLSIAEGCVIRNAFIGPYTSIGEYSFICDSRIEYSILMDNCTINGMENTMDSCILGSNAQILRRNNKMKSVKINMGSYSTMEYL